MDIIKVRKDQGSIRIDYHNEATVSELMLTYAIIMLELPSKIKAMQIKAAAKEQSGIVVPRG